MTHVIASADHLRYLAEQFKVPQEIVQRAHDVFQSRVQELGAPWGDDEIGQQFSQKYLPALKCVLEGLTDVAAGLGDLADYCIDMATNVQTTEEVNAS